MSLIHQQALDCFASDDLIGIGMEADAIRRHLHPEGVVTYVSNRSVCATAADFDVQAAEAVEAGITSLTLLGSFAELTRWETLLSGLRDRYPSIWLHGLSATEVVNLAATSVLTLEEVLIRLRDAGLQSLSGADAGILGFADSTRCASPEWQTVHRAAHALGLPSTASMRFGAGESIEHRLAHVEILERLQQETGGFLSFRASAAPLPNFEEATAVEYLKTLAVSRLVLNTITHLEADWHSQGLKVLQMALRFGANDVGSLFAGESLRNPDGTTEEDLRRVVRGAGFRPVERDAAFRTLFVG